MDLQGRGEMAEAWIGAGSAQCPPGVAVYDADGEQLGTVSDWQDMRHYLIVHQGRLFGHEAYIPQAAIMYSDMNGVHLRLRHDDLINIQQPLPEHTAPPSTISMVLPILTPGMGVAAVAASAFAHDVISHPASASSSSSQLVEAAQGTATQTGPLAGRVKSRRLWRRAHR
jgi:hypothetical protein